MSTEPVASMPPVLLEPADEAAAPPQEIPAVQSRKLVSITAPQGTTEAGQEIPAVRSRKTVTTTPQPQDTGVAGAGPGPDVASRRMAQIKNVGGGEQHSFSPAQLRQLFRLMDLDNSHELSFTELRNGLAAMGFAHAQEPTVINRLLEELDSDRSGLINEQEFVTFFQKLQRHDLQAKLSTYSLGGQAAPEEMLHIVAIVYSGRGTVDEGKHVTRKLVNPSELASFIQEYVLSEEASVCDHHVWLDVVGFNDSVISLLSNMFGLHEETLMDAYIFQRQKVEIAPREGEVAVADALLPAHTRSLTHNSIGVSSPPIHPDDVTLGGDGDEGETGGVAFAKKMQAIRRRASQLPPVIPGSTRMLDIDRASVVSGVEAAPLRPQPATVQFLLHAMALANPPFADSGFAGTRTCVTTCCGCGPTTSVIRASAIPGRDAALEAARDLSSTFECSGGHPSSPSKSTLGHTPRRVSLDGDELSFSDVHGHGRGCCGCKLGHGLPGSKVLASRQQLSLRPPDIAVEQFSVIVVNDRTVITLRNSTVSTGGQSYLTEGRSSSMRGLRGGDDATILGILFAGLRRRIRGVSDASGYLYTSSIRALVCDILDAVTQYNFGLRDTLKDWHQKLEDSIQASASTMHTPHLYALAKVTDICARQLEPLKTAFQVAAADMGGAMMEHIPADVGYGEPRQWLISAAGGPKSLTLGVQFADQMPMLVELRDDVTALHSDIQGVRESITNLKSLLSSLQDEFMNRILFILTLVTTFCTPFAILTGYFGMNFPFETMDNDWGVNVFWIAAAVCVAFMAIVFTRAGFFNVIS